MILYPMTRQDLLPSFGQGPPIVITYSILLYCLQSIGDVRKFLAGIPQFALSACGGESRSGAALEPEVEPGYFFNTNIFMKCLSYLSILQFHSLELLDTIHLNYKLTCQQCIL